MEQKHTLLYGLGVGVGVGVGLGLVTRSTFGRWSGCSPSSKAAVSAQDMQSELSKLVVDGNDSKITLNDFPYYLSERTRLLLMSAAYVHLTHLDVSKHTRNLSPASRAILLSGPGELYKQILAEALAHHFGAKFLFLDIADFSLKLQRKYGSTKRNSSSLSEATLERMSSFLGSFSILRSKEDNRVWRGLQNVLLNTVWKQSGELDTVVRNNVSSCSCVSSDFTSSTSVVSSSSNAAPSKRMSLDEKTFLQSLYKVLVSISQTSSMVLYIREAEKIFLQSSRLYKLFDRMLKKLSGPVLILGSTTLNHSEDSWGIDDRISLLFPYNIGITPPEDETHLLTWKSQLEEDMKKIQIDDNKNHIAEVLVANDIECDDLGSIGYADTADLSNYIEEIVVSAVSYHFMNNKIPEYRNGRLVISSKSLSHGLSIFQGDGKYSLKMDSESTEKMGSKSDVKNKNEAENSVSCENPSMPPEVPPVNEFEKRIWQEVIPANEVGVTFGDIGALDEIKESLQELVMLPLRRPDLFNGGLLKPCRGILLFGPPGTGKTMLAKAIANEAGASFINISLSTITSSWFGEDEKNVRALFTLAAKVSPSIIFVDEVDGMFGERSRVGEHEAMRKIKNEFMTHWDGVLTKTGVSILVLASTNRPFDLDEAIIRRFERRILVDLPSVESREKILRTLLSKEKMENLDIKGLAAMTEGYSGSDLKNLCITAAYRPAKELIQQERLKEKKKKQDKEAQKSEPEEDIKEEKVISLRPLNMEDMMQAKNLVAASFASEGFLMGELEEWNEMYGEGGSRKKKQLSYFL